MILSLSNFGSKVKQLLWPIYRHEYTKFFSMSALMFCVLFNQNVLRILKDSLLIAEISVEVTSFIKVYCVTPAAALFVIIYAKLVNTYNFQQIYRYLLIVFVSYFVLFAFIIFPNIHYFHISSSKLNAYMLQYPHFKWYIALIGNWSYVLYYVLAELWPNIFYVLLFWQFANEITKTNEAKRFYTLFSLFGNSSLILVGYLMMHLASENSIAKKFFDIDNKLLFIQTASIFIIIIAIISDYFVRYISNNVLTDPTLYHKAKNERSTKPKLGVIDSFKYILTSRYLWLMLICSASFGLTMNLVEAIWKAKTKELYPTLNEFAQINSLYIMWTGVAIMLMTVLGNVLMRYYRWLTVALITPLVILISGCMFFILVVFDKQFVIYMQNVIIYTPLALAVFIGAIQNIIAKGTKYSIWDTSREMLYIPLDNELKSKGKAAVDIVSSKIGKSSSGLVQALLFTLFPYATYNTIAPFMAIIFIATCLIWIEAIKKINIEYTKIV